MTRQRNIPIDTRALFKPLDHQLVKLLKSLNEEDWSRQTVAKQWKVKDVASHLLDGNLKTLSMQRDGYFGEQPPEIKNKRDLINWLNQLNADWVNVSRRLSPQVLTMLLASTGDLVSDYFASLDPFHPAIFAVDWAGESESLNWMHVAREYTEKWHHQQQIRDAVSLDGILTKEFFYPVIDTFFKALPYTFRKIAAEPNTVVKTTVTTEAGGNWYLIKKENEWQLTKEVDFEPDAIVEIPIDISWKLFSKSLRPADVIDDVKISGNELLGKSVLQMVSVMA